MRCKKVGSKKVIVVGVLVPFFILSIFAYVALALTVDDVARDLICPCGCGKMLDVCEMESAKEMKGLIGEKIAQGETKDQIIGYFVSQYGEKVLAAPTKKGFNLTAWVAPFLVIGLGAGIISLVIVKWVLRGKIREEEIKKTQQEKVQGKYAAKLKKELEKFEF